MAISVLFIESDAVHAQAMCDRVTGEGLDWQLEVTSSLADARLLLSTISFDALVVSHRLPDGPADALGSILEQCAALLLQPDGVWLDSALLVRQGFTDFLPKDPAFQYLDSLTTRILMAIERHHTVRQLRQRSETLEVAVAGAEVGIWDWRVREDRNIVNERWCEMLGYASEEVVLVGGVWMDWVHPDDLLRLRGALGTGPKTSLQQFDVEFRIRHRLGHWVWIHSCGHVVERDEQGLPTRVAGTHTDVTERKKTEQAREQQHRLLQTISVAHALFLSDGASGKVFEGLLSELLTLTQGDFGFVGEVLFSGENKPFIKMHAITNIAWDAASRRLYEENAARGMEFHNLKTLFGSALVSGKPVIANEPAIDPRKGGIPHGHPPLNAFLGIPIHHGNELVAMIGLANKPGGYSQADIDFLAPLCSTIGHLVAAWRSDRERHRVQDELRRAGELLARESTALELTLDSMSQGICTVEADGRVSVINRQLQDLLDLPDSLLTDGLTADDIFRFQLDRGDFGPNFELVESHARPYVMGDSVLDGPDRYLRTTRSGKTLEVESRRLVNGGLVRTFSDVTKYLQAQTALLASEARFRSLTELSSDWYWLQDEHYRFLRVEGDYASRCDLPQTAYVGLWRWDIETLNLTQDDWQAHRDDLDARRVFRDFEMCRLDPTGQLHWVSISGMPIFDDAGQFRGYRGVGRTITERKRLDAQLQKASEQLAHKSAQLQLTLDNMSQGISLMEPNGRMSIYNRKAIELLDLPESLLAGGPSLVEVLQFQRDRGDFKDALDLVSPGTKDIILHGQGDMQETYVRKTRAGKLIEVKSNPIPDGSMVRTYTDVSSYIDAQNAARESEARFRALAGLSSDWYWEQDENFRFIRFEGDSVMEASPYLATVGQFRWDTPALNLTESDWVLHRADLQAHRVFKDLEIQRATPDGASVWVSVSGAPIFDAVGRFTGYRGIGRDITERKQAEDQIERLAFYDALTELPNRRMLIERLGQAMTSSSRSHQHAALLFIDLDNFKMLNDTHGHYMGDLLLQQVAVRLRGSVREVDTVARLGGDEFVVMVEELSQDETQAAAQVKVVAEKILVALNQIYPLRGQEHHSTPSLGITLFLGQQETSDELLKRADLAMYQAKAAGRNTLRFFDPAMQAAVATRAELEKDLRQCLLRDELVLYYQPVVDVDRVITGVEALVRWRHPVRGLVMPAEFIGLAEQSGLIVPLGQWVLQTACGQLVDWAGQPETQDLTMSVNVSERQIRQADFVGKVCDVLAQTGAKPGLLKLEITESLLLTDAEDIIAKMGALKTIGVRFSLDDFGTGYSSLGYLKRLPIDQLKIDKSFVRDVLTDPNDAAIAQTILALAGSLGLQAVAEGVETEGQLKFLMQSGCRSFQGYYFGRPEPAPRMNALLKAAEPIRA
ncbi:MAG TPA: EAL domain-containing protein [Burkholderiaceae bacterium]|nr:EAL domain-containing protein [Burkholderiaceae bacterium]